MNISTTKGHLTQTNKKHIKAVIEQVNPYVNEEGQHVQSGTVNRITYHVTTLEPGKYSVKILQWRTNDWGDRYRDKHTAEFTLKP